MTRECDRLHLIFNSLPRQRFPLNFREIPANGIYILFEEGELAHGADRIVRVGTHTGNGMLPSRLKEHFLKENKDRSIFRKNIGRALLNKTGDPFLEQWEWDLTSRAARDDYLSRLDRSKLKVVEKAVSETICSKFSFVVFRVDDKNLRLELEKKIISTVSLCEECRPSSNWLGLHSPVEKIRQSGLWLVNGLYGQSLSLDEINFIERLSRNSQPLA